MSSEDFSTKRVLWGVGSVAFTILLSTNAFFIARLVERIDHVSSIEERLGVLEAKFDMIIKQTRGD